jgi:collagenase-like PrtC family protease
MGVTSLRISPQGQGTEAVVAQFRAALDGQTPDARELAALAPTGLCDGYWQGREGIKLGELEHATH